MDKKLQDKSSNFLKREGFYVILFLCLCIVATVAAVSSRNNKKAESKPPVVDNNKKDRDELVVDNTSDQEKSIDNAIEVKKNENNNSVTVPKNPSETAAVSKTNSTAFEKPVEGNLAREYTTETIYCETLSTWRTKPGIDIKAELGKKVVAVLDGVVEKIDDDTTELGKHIVINHQNGLKTIYANLDQSVLVKVGDKVTKGQQIGKVGKTAGNYSSEKFGDHLHFRVLKDNTDIDPAKYVKYSPLSKS